MPFKGWIDVPLQKNTLYSIIINIQNNLYNKTAQGSYQSGLRLEIYSRDY